MKQNANEHGEVYIADEVVGIIAGLAATEVQGVKGMAGGIAGGLAEFLGKKNLSKGVKVDVGERETTIDLYLVIEYGIIVPTVARKVQDNVKKAVEGMTGLKVVEANIHVTGVDIPYKLKAEEKKKEEEQEKREEGEEEKEDKKTKKGKKEDKKRGEKK